MATHRGLASPFGLPLGLELYSVRDELPKDYAGTLKKVAALGYRDVEAAGFYGHSAAEAKAASTSVSLDTGAVANTSPVLGSIRGALGPSSASR